MEGIRGNYFLHNNNFVEASQINELINSELLQVYEVLRVINCKAVFIIDHLERLRYSILGAGNILPGQIIPDVENGIKRIIEKNNIKEGNIKILIQFSRIKTETFIYFIPHFYPPDKNYLQGVEVGLFKTTRENPNIKAPSYLREKINTFLKTNQLYEVLLVDEDEKITEGSRTNVFFIDSQNNVITAPDDFVLKGVTRKYLIQLCKKNNFYLSYQFVHKNDISKYKSVFLTGTSPKILPVRQIENITFETNSVVLEKLMNDYDKLISK